MGEGEARMTDYAEQVWLLHRRFKSWRGVSKRCGYSPAYWMRIAKKDLKPSEKAIFELTREVTRCYQRKFQRKNITVSTPLYQRMKTLKMANKETWEEFGQKALEARLENQ